MNKDIEYIICSAMYIDDGIEYSDQAINIKTGFIICGRRHNNCSKILSILKGKEYINEYSKSERFDSTKIFGFLTNFDRYVTRSEAARIANDAGQSDKVKILISEHIFFDKSEEDLQQLYDEDRFEIPEVRGLNFINKSIGIIGQDYSIASLSQNLKEYSDGKADRRARRWYERELKKKNK